MVLAFTILLGISCAGMVALLSIKHWEITTGRVVFEGVRPKLGRFFHSVLATAERAVPAILQEALERFFEWGRSHARAGLARALLAAETWLERALHVLRHKTVPPQSASGEASAFLREVAEHKKKLLKRGRSNRVIVDSFLDKLQ